MALRIAEKLWFEMAIALKEQGNSCLVLLRGLFLSFVAQLLTLPCVEVSVAWGDLLVKEHCFLVLKV